MVGNCCYPDEYSDLFDGREAGRVARRFRKRGLSGPANNVVEAVLARGIDGASVLEVGGGVGEIHIALLEAGASQATNVDLSGNWETEAASLLREHELDQRVQRRVADFVDAADDIDPADVVVLHRVLCCYPDLGSMLATVADHSRRVVALTVPRDTWWVRAFMVLSNRWLALRRRQFRAFVHPISDMVTILGDAGFDVVDDRSRPVWRTLVFERA
jgi:magnesium-protoporphyrin O-methyltransferase